MAARATSKIYLDELDLSAARQGYGQTRAGLSTDGKPLRVAGRTYERGVGSHATMELIVNLPPGILGFSSFVGLAEEVGKAGSASFELQADGRTIFQSGLMVGAEDARRAMVDLEGVRQLVVLVHDGGDGIEMDHVVWGEAFFECEPGTPVPGTVPLAEQDLADVAPFDPAEFAIHYPRLVGAGVGHPFVFRIPATGPGPLRFSAVRLPPGLTLDEKTGILRGTIAEPGEFLFPVTVRCGALKIDANFVVLAGAKRLARTPPMGWSSWSCHGPHVDAAKIIAAAEGLDASGLTKFGYRYINIDDGWQGKRDRRGSLLAHAGFPAMDDLTSRIHALGLSAGIYSSPGRKTCAGMPGSFGHVQEDARRFAGWGFDYLKYDFCSYVRELRRNDRMSHMAPYEAMAAALGQLDRDIVFSICNAGEQDVWEWGAMVGGQLWRTTEDIFDSWGSVAGIGFRHGAIASFAGPGAWNDPDGLMLGEMGWGNHMRPSRLTPVEQQTHVTLWALLAAPLLLGCDMAKLDPFTLALAGNPEVLAVDQDPAGRQAVPVFRDGQQEAWARLLEDGSVAVGLFNRAPLRQQVSVLFEEAGVQGFRRCDIRDLWRRKDLGLFDDGFSASLPPHGSMLLRLQPV